MELLEKGSLEDIIKNVMLSIGPSDYTNTTRQIILFGISSRMDYLHQRNIIHRDLKAGNILLDSEYHPLITDFGLSKFLTINNSYRQSQFCGTLPYEAPEIIENKKYNRKVDVYAFGILMYEILTDSFAYPELLKSQKMFFQRNFLISNQRSIFSMMLMKMNLKFIMKMLQNLMNKTKIKTMTIKFKKKNEQFKIINIYNFPNLNQRIKN